MRCGPFSGVPLNYVSVELQAMVSSASYSSCSLASTSSLRSRRRCPAQTRFAPSHPSQGSRRQPPRKSIKHEVLSMLELVDGSSGSASHVAPAVLRFLGVKPVFASAKCPRSPTLCVVYVFANFVARFSAFAEFCVRAAFFAGGTRLTTC